MNIILLRGYLYLLVVGLTLASLLLESLLTLASTLLWIIAIISYRQISSRSLKQTLILIGLGVAGIGYSAWLQVPIPWLKLLHNNTVLLAMLIAVSLLSLVVAPRPNSKQRVYPKGSLGLMNTLLANHLFGSIINVSSIVVIGERLKKIRPIDLPMGAMLSLSFGICSLWSPFFAAMAYTFTLVPDMNLYQVMLIGLPLAGICLVIIYIIGFKHNIDQPGYPLKGRSLVIPAVLAAVVMLAHHFIPTAPMPMIVIMAVLILVGCILGYEKQLKQIHDNCRNGFNHFINQIAIFFAAGVFSVGIGQVFLVSGLQLPFTQYGAVEASLTLIFGLLAARLGMHAIIIMALLNPLLQTLQPPPNMLALTYLAIWGLGMAFNPVSGTLLTIQGLFNVPGFALARYNTPWVILLGGITCGMFFIMAWLGI